MLLSGGAGVPRGESISAWLWSGTKNGRLSIASSLLFSNFLVGKTPVRGVAACKPPGYKTPSLCPLPWGMPPSILEPVVEEAPGVYPTPSPKLVFLDAAAIGGYQPSALRLLTLPAKGTGGMRGRTQQTMPLVLCCHSWGCKDKVLGCKGHLQQRLSLPKPPPSSLACLDGAIRCVGIALRHTLVYLTV